MIRQRRNYFRVEYPITCRPALVMGDQTYVVTNLSENGIKFLVEDVDGFGVGQPTHITLRFRDGELLDLTGEIKRVERHAVCILLADPVPLKKIRSEELYLIKHFPALRT